MPRVARNQLKTNLFHIIQQSPLTIFRNQEDRVMFVDIVKKAKRKYQFNCYGFSCCLDQKFELILHVKYQSISKIMQTILISYAKYYDESKTLFPNRYKSIALHDEKVITHALSAINSDIGYSKMSLCHYASQRDTSYKLIDFFTKDSIFVLNPLKTLNLDDTFSQYLVQHGCDEQTLLSNSTLRNQCILKLYQTTGCTLKDIANRFNLSVSMISKILNNKA